MEFEILCRAAVEHVPARVPLFQTESETSEVGNDVTIVSYGHPPYVCFSAIAAVEKEFDMSVKLLDFRNLDS